MRRIVLGVIGSVLVLAASALADTKDLTLDQAFALTKERSERLAISREQVVLAEARYSEAVGALFPQISLNAAERLRNSGDTGNQFGDSTGIGTSGFSGSRSDRFLMGVGLHQPIFAGFRDILLAQSLKAEKRSQNYLSEREMELLYADLAEVFYQVILYQGDMQELGETLIVLRQRIKELNQFVGLGKARESEVLAAEEEIAQTEATIGQTEGLLSASREALAFLTGLPAEELRPVSTLNSGIVPGVEEWLARGKTRSDLKAAIEKVDASQKELTAAEREHWPVVSLEGNYYLDESPETSREWDTLFKLEVPIFSGGQIDARIRQQESLLRQTELKKQELGRAAERDIRTAYVNYTSARKQVQRLGELVKASEKNYQSQRDDYQLGIVNNLDVLQGIRSLRDAKRKLLLARIQEMTNVARLAVAAGGLS